MTEEEKTEYLNLRYSEIQQIISDYQDDNITDFNVEYRADVSIYYKFIKLYENEEFENAFSELKYIEKNYEINTVSDDETYFEMRTSHLSENEKLQLLHYIDNDEDNVRNIEFWLYERMKNKGD